MLLLSLGLTLTRNITAGKTGAAHGLISHSKTWQTCSGIRLFRALHLAACSWSQVYSLLQNIQAWPAKPDTFLLKGKRRERDTRNRRNEGKENDTWRGGRESLTPQLVSRIQPELVEIVTSSRSLSLTQDISELGQRRPRVPVTVWVTSTIVKLTSGAKFFSPNSFFKGPKRGRWLEQPIPSFLWPPCRFNFQHTNFSSSISCLTLCQDHFW